MTPNPLPRTPGGNRLIVVDKSMGSSTPKPAPMLIAAPSGTVDIDQHAGNEAQSVSFNATPTRGVNSTYTRQLFPTEHVNCSGNSERSYTADLPGRNILHFSDNLSLHRHSVAA